MTTVNQVDADALAENRLPEWQRLNELSRNPHPTGAEVDELVARYRSASADLAELKSTVGESPQGAYLSTVLAAARLRLTGSPQNVLVRVGDFFVWQLPAALYRLRKTTAWVAAVFLAIATIVALWIVLNPAVVDALWDAETLKAYAEEDFTGYYTENPAAVFAGMVWTNNAWIAVQCVLFGVTGIWPVFSMVQNAMNLGLAAGSMAAYGNFDVMLLHILPHGMLELTALFVAAAGGLHLFWAWVAPGERSRAEALAAGGRSLATVAIGLVFTLALAGLVEGFVTGWWLPWPVKIAIGAAALGVFLWYMLFVGRRAARHGETGDLVEFEAGTPKLVAG